MTKIRRLLSNIYRFFFPISLVEMYQKMGVKIGENCKFQFDVVIDYSHYWLIHIGNNVTLAPRVHILAHDASVKQKLGYSKIGLTRIEDNVFVGAGSIILPGITIEEGAIIGAGSVVTKNVPANCVSAGNPAKVITTVDEYLEKIRKKMHNSNCLDASYTTRENITQDKKKEMIQIIEKNGIAFVE